MKHTRKKRNLIHWITRVSVVGIAITTAALVVLLSAFNGIEKMVEQLYSEYDPAIIMRSTQGKTVDSTTIDFQALRAFKHVRSVSKAVEETVILKRGKKWVNARMVGVDFAHVSAIHLKNHILEGFPALEENGNPVAIIGASLLDKLDGYISELDGYDELMIYTPLREASMTRMKNPFKISPLKVIGRMNYNREVNISDILVPIEFAQMQLNYEKDITAVYIDVDSKYAQQVKAELQKRFGAKFSFKTAAEKNELIFKTSQSEKKIVFLILIFIFILAAFNLIASLNMLFIEKKENIETLKQLGASPAFVFRIFFYEGILISLKGVFFGLLLGVAVCLIQMQFQLLKMPNAIQDGFPIVLTWEDILFVLLTVIVLSVMMSYFPVRYLVAKNKAK